MIAVNRKDQSCLDLPPSIRLRMMASQPPKPARKSSIAVLLPGIVSKGRFVGEPRFTLLESGVDWESCGLLRNSVQRMTFSNTRPRQVRRKKCQVQELRSETIPQGRDRFGDSLPVPDACPSS